MKNTITKPKTRNVAIVEDEISKILDPARTQPVDVQIALKVIAFELAGLRVVTRGVLIAAGASPKSASISDLMDASDRLAGLLEAVLAGEARKSRAISPVIGGIQ